MGRYLYRVPSSAARPARVSHAASGTPARRRATLGSRTDGHGGRLLAGGDPRTTGGSFCAYSTSESRIGPPLFLRNAETRKDSDLSIGITDRVFLQGINL